MALQKNLRNRYEFHSLSGNETIVIFQSRILCGLAEELTDCLQIATHDSLS